jgi:malate dehydrogenase (oxaloacetate-decarboxylating)
MAGIINALKVVGKKKAETRIVFNGIGSSNFAIQRVLNSAGFDIKKALFVDSHGILYKGRSDLQDPADYKYEIAQRSNPEQVQGDCGKAMEGADVLISLSTPGPDVIKKPWIKKMAHNAIVFVCANPVPEIFPWDAKEAGAKIVATGRSDFPNQVNNSLGFPGIFRGTLDCRASTITDEMCIAAAEELAKVAEEKGLTSEYIIPTMEDRIVFVREAVAVAKKAKQQGIARLPLSDSELTAIADKLITEAHRATQLLMESGLIPEYKNYID